MDATPWAAIIVATVSGAAIIGAAIFKSPSRKNGNGGNKAPGVFVLEKVCEEKHSGLDKTIVRLEAAGDRFIAKLDESTLLLHSRIDRRDA